MGGNIRIDFKRILCPTDLSPESDEVLRYAIDLALAYEAKLFVCHCVGSSPPADESMSQRIKRLVALYLIAYGQPIIGLMTFIGARIIGTALVARIFALTQRNLLRIGWFTWLYDRFLAFKTHVHEAVKSTGVYKAAHRLRLRMRVALVEISPGRRTLWRSR
jgi:universal stress protein family protein